MITDPPPRPVKPSSAFISDTLAPLLGGPFTVRQMPFREHQAELPIEKRWPEQPGQTWAGRTMAPDTVVVYDESPHPEHTLQHEAGHVWDARGIAPDVAMQVQQAMTTFKPRNKQEQYFRGDDFEYIAETFARALEHARKPGGNLEDADRRWPGVKAMVTWMMSRKPFAAAAAGAGR